jgi:hypothetical protein
MGRLQERIEESLAYGRNAIFFQYARRVLFIPVAVAPLKRWFTRTLTLITSAHLELASMVHLQIE